MTRPADPDRILAPIAFGAPWRCTARVRGSVAEVVELQGDAEVVLLQLGDHLLEVVALLAADPQLVALGLRLDALEAEVLDEMLSFLALSLEMPALSVAVWRTVPPRRPRPCRRSRP